MIRPLALSLAFACVSTPSTSTVTTPPITSLHVALTPITALRDLNAVGDAPDLSFSWSVDGAATDHVGPTIPARDLAPGQQWTVTATHPDGLVAEDSYTIPEPPGGNVLVIIVDDIGLDHVGAYGLNPEAPPTPRIDALASSGVRFTRAYATPVCSSSRAALLTGRYPRRHGVGWIIDTGTRDFALPDAALTLAEAMDEAWPAPWPTSAVGKWHIAGPLYERYLEHPNDQGFDWYEGSNGNPLYAEGTGYWVWNENTNGVVTEETTYMTTETTDDALLRIDTMAEPWLLYLAFNAAHTPLSAPPPELTTLEVTDDSDDNDLFDATVEALDSEIGRLLDTMDPELLARTTLILVGDNGTPVHAIDPPFDPDHDKETAYEGGVRVPLVITGPLVAAPGTVSTALVHIADVFPTVLEIAGVPLAGPDDALVVDVDAPVPVDGRSLLPQLANPEAPGRDLLYTEGFFPNGSATVWSIDKRMLRDERYKILRLGESTESLFDLQLDPLGFDDGPDLLLEPMDSEAEEAWQRLSDALDALEAELEYEGF